MVLLWPKDRQGQEKVETVIRTKRIPPPLPLHGRCQHLFTYPLGTFLERLVKIHRCPSYGLLSFCGIQSIWIGETIGLEGENPKLPLVKTGHVFSFDRKELKTKWEGIGLNLSPAMLYKQAPTPFNARMEILCMCHEVSPPTPPSHLIHLLLVCANVH